MGRMYGIPGISPKSDAGPENRAIYQRHNAESRKARKNARARYRQSIRNGRIKGRSDFFLADGPGPFTEPVAFISVGGVRVEPMAADRGPLPLPGPVTIIRDRAGR